MFSVWAGHCLTTASARTPPDVGVAVYKGFDVKSQVTLCHFPRHQLLYDILEETGLWSVMGGKEGERRGERS